MPSLTRYPRVLILPSIQILPIQDTLDLHLLELPASLGSVTLSVQAVGNLLHR